MIARSREKTFQGKPSKGKGKTYKFFKKVFGLARNRYLSKTYSQPAVLLHVPYNHQRCQKPLESL